jgi:acyl carrier protein
MMKTIEERLTRILCDSFKVRRESIGSGTTLADHGFDSLVIVELALVLDNEFGISLGEGELADTMTVTDAAELMAAKGAVL